MAIDKKNITNVDNSQPAVYPNGHTQDETGSDNGTPLNNELLSDKFETWDKLMRLYGITFNNLPDNETNGFQFVEALTALASKNDFVLDITEDSGDLVIPIKLGFLKDNESIILKATVDKTTETDLKGSLDNVTKPITFSGDFKTGEYVRMINLASSVILIRMVDLNNIADVLTGDGSDNYLASSSNNGLVPGSRWKALSKVIAAGIIQSNGTGSATIAYGWDVASSSRISTGRYSIGTLIPGPVDGVIFSIDVYPTVDNIGIYACNTSTTPSSVSFDIRKTSDDSLVDITFGFYINQL